MSPGLCFPSWFLLCWLLAMAEGQEVVTPAEEARNPTDCQIFTLTPPPTTRKPATRAKPITRIPTFVFIPQRRPRVFPGFPNRPFFPPNCNRRFQFQPFYWPQGGLPARRYFLGRYLQSRSSSEESNEEGDI